MMATAATPPLPGTARNGLQLAHHALASLLGGYLFTWGITALGLVLLVAAGVDFHAAETGLLLLAFPLFLAVFLYAFAAIRTSWVWAGLAGGGLLLAGAGWALQALVPG